MRSHLHGYPNSGNDASNSNSMLSSNFIEQKYANNDFTHDITSGRGT
jgi:hypothetical protein